MNFIELKSPKERMFINADQVVSVASSSVGSLIKLTNGYVYVSENMGEVVEALNHGMKLTLMQLTLTLNPDWDCAECS